MCIRDRYWSLGSRDKRASFLCSLVETSEPKVMRKRAEDPEKEKCRQYTHQFHLKTNGKKCRVCRGCFMKTLGEINMFITVAIAFGLRSTSGITKCNKRGRDPPPTKLSHEAIKAIKDNIQPFPAYESHYTRTKSEKKYLPSFLNLSKMYSFYKE